MRLPTVLVASLAMACGPATTLEDRLSITARDAAREAYTAAASLAPDAALRWVEGEGVTADGLVRPDRGEWRLVYDSPSGDEQIVVTVTPRTQERETRAPQSPPGFVLGNAVLPDRWIDSPTALAAIDELGELRGANLSMLLIPTPTPRWIVNASGEGWTRQWRVDAQTGEVLAS